MGFYIFAMFSYFLCIKKLNTIVLLIINLKFKKHVFNVFSKALIEIS